MGRMNEEIHRTDDAVRIRLEKVAGSDGFSREVEASSPLALIKGLAVLMLECAGMMNMPVSRLYAVLATVLFAPEEREENNNNNGGQNNE